MNENLIRLYNALGIRPGASLSEVKQAYKDLVRVWHPDRFMDDERMQKKSNEELKKINEAYNELTKILYTELESKTNEETDIKNVRESYYEQKMNKAEDMGDKYKKNDSFEDISTTFRDSLDDLRVVQKYYDLGCLFYFILVAKIVTVPFIALGVMSEIDEVVYGRTNVLIYLLLAGFMIWLVMSIKRDIKKIKNRG